MGEVKIYMVALLNVLNTEMLLNIVTVIISLLALLSSAYIGYMQMKISKTQMDFQNKVELYLIDEYITIRDSSGTYPDKKIPAIIIRNIGSNVVYLEKYIFNGREYPLETEVLPPVSAFEGIRYIELPTDATKHVSFTIYFKDWKCNPWKTTGFADWINGKWEIKYSPCGKRK